MYMLIVMLWSSCSVSPLMTIVHTNMCCWTPHISGKQTEQFVEMIQQAVSDVTKRGSLSGVMSDLRVLSSRTLLFESCFETFRGQPEELKRTTRGPRSTVCILWSIAVATQRTDTARRKQNWSVRRATDRVTVKRWRIGKEPWSWSAIPACLRQESGLQDNFPHLDEAERQRVARPFILWSLRNCDQCIFHLLHQMLRSTLATGQLRLTQITVKLVPRSKQTLSRL